MKATIEISKSHLRQLLRNINKINAVPDEDTHADVHLKIEKNAIGIYSIVDPIFVIHKFSKNGDIDIDIESPGNISFNIETLSNIVQKAEGGMFEIEFMTDNYKIKTPGSNAFSSVKFRLPRHTESHFRDPITVGDLYEIDTVPRSGFISALGTMEVIDDFVNIMVENDDLKIQIKNKVTGEADIERENCGAEVEAMSQYYLIRPMRVFAETLSYADEITILVSEKQNLCLRSVYGNWASEIHLAKKSSTQLDTYLNI